MKYLPEDPHTFTLKTVIDEHASRLVEIVEVNDDKGNKTPESVIARFKCFDKYELCNFSLSRLAVESLIHPDLHAEVVVKYSHMKNLKKSLVIFISWWC